MKKLTTPSPYLNGKHEAPPDLGGASSLRSSPLSTPSSPPPTLQPTQFLDDVQGISWRTFCYHLSHQECLGFSLLRIVTWLLLLLAGVWALGALPGRWWGCSASLLLLLGLCVTLRHQRRRDFVHFVVDSDMDTAPKAFPQALAPDRKIAVYATGQFEVEGKKRRFTMIPGFYRTFATREHATICQIRPRRFLGICNCPDEEVGLWYAFFIPAAIREIRLGHLYFDRVQRHALAIRYEQTIANPRKADKSKVIEQTLYLVVDSQSTIQTILADLYADLSTHLKSTNALGHER
jgi:hypothetical protein